MNLRNLLIGFAGGLLAAGAAVWLMMPGMMLKEYQSPFGVEETVNEIKKRAVAEGWVVSDVVRLNDSVIKHGGGALPPVRLLNLCQAHHAYRILKEDGNKIVSVMMPCTISVYEKDDGKTYVGTMNAGLMGKMFGGTLATVMGGEVAEQQKRFVGFLPQ